VVLPRTLPVRFVLYYDSSVDPANVAAWSDFAEDCGHNAVSPYGVAGFAPWGECIARKYVEQTNAAFAELLGTTTPFLAFESFSSAMDAELTRGHTSTELATLVQPRVQANVVTVFVVLSITGTAAGVANLMQAYPSVASGVFAVVQADTPWQAVAHEIGHAVGFPHVSGPTVGTIAKYPCCGGFEANAIQGGCDASSNIMCESSGSSFDSCEHGAFLKKIAACWLSGQGAASCVMGCNVWGSDHDVPLAACSYANGQYTCTCAGTAKTYSGPTCTSILEKYQAACVGVPPVNGVCDVFGPNTCPSGNACYAHFGLDNDCLPTGSLPLGAACVERNDCAPGSVCIETPPSGAKLCAKVCNPDTDAGCSFTDCSYYVNFNGVAVCAP
jgi:hypothetical protein